MVKVIINIKLLLIFTKLGWSRHKWQLKTAIFLRRYLMCVVLLAKNQPMRQQKSKAIFKWQCTHWNSLMTHVLLPDPCFILYANLAYFAQPVAYITQPLRKYYTTFTYILHNFCVHYTTFAYIACNFCVSITQLLRKYYLTCAYVLCNFCVSFT